MCIITIIKQRHAAAARQLILIKSNYARGRIDAESFSLTVEMVRDVKQNQAGSGRRVCCCSIEFRVNVKQ